jgi:hypothetical protein
MCQILGVNAKREGGRRDEGLDDLGRSGKECFSGSRRPTDKRSAVS